MWHKAEQIEHPMRQRWKYQNINADKSEKKQFEEINQKILAKKGRLKRYWDMVKQYKQKGIF